LIRALTIAAILTVTVMFSAAPSAQAAVTLSKAEQAVLNAVNKERADRGLPRLRAHASLMKAARAHSADMAVNGYLSHTSHDGTSMANRIRSHGYASSGWLTWKVGENIARATPASSAAKPTSIVAAWMKSPGHRAAILTKAYRDAGIGTRAGADWRCFTLDLGRRTR
jgi:uncharacterized protein YkwD